METIAALDPGRDKCGFAVLDTEGSVLFQKVLETKKLEQEVRNAQKQYGFTRLIEGNGTTSKEAQARLTRAMPELIIKVVDEYRTTDMARKAYWQAKPPKGWRRFIPLGLQVPPEPVDDFVAVILATRYIKEYYHD
ncbi:pre-16S rRNA-processing nuclease YqgF [Mitsuokella sp. WILCCON 0060]|uniref:pre-16S rRNA-processing nuclease YqgF n=1 Tax=unclassified Mitsuokella TaxID=2637239 RepID=UPI003F101052